MRKNVLVALVVALTVSSSLAFAASTPLFNAPVKFGEGVPGRGHGRMAVDGQNFYATFGTETAAMANTNGRIQDAVRIVKSANRGALWGRSTALQTSDFSAFPVAFTAVDQFSARVAISNDPLYPGQKIVHTIWKSTESSGVDNIYYSFFATRPDQNGWSAPVKINGTTNVMNGAELVVTASGSIHVVYGSLTGAQPAETLYYTGAQAPGGIFSEPTVLPLPAYQMRVGEPALAVDSSDNVYAAYVADSKSVYLNKKPALSYNWSAPQLVADLGSMSQDLSLAVADSNSYYIAVIGGVPTESLSLMVTTDGGTTWRARTLIADHSYGGITSGPSVVVSPTKVITVASETGTVVDWNYTFTGIKVWRSDDNGATWSAPASVKGQSNPRLILDSSNKANLSVADEQNNDGSNLLWIRER
ncbi:hypothetical protein Geob_0151 [Geotalea daltonii FRC-32]|uniref:Exo-alpha-sialidase n=1 Tax=Geotalea daltonii (strain DSM 22248 / JCM 15807 / FRC-32) TaxID=316067 RepID=B9M8J0_GEODF|nr:sialidase family protein [Geotalea daltonii]ACM18525.1 hypothetical protein Geob_0151 [Geotalea daltonii FRC-32]